MPAIQHKTLRQETLSAIHEMILSGRLEPGARLIELDLAEQLGVSRGPIREALRQLEQEGLVEYVPNRGCFVRQVKPQDILESDMIQTQMEIMALELQGGVLPDALLEQLERVVDGMSAKGLKTTLGELLKEDEDFHRIIIQSVGMDRLCRIWEGISQSSVILLEKFQREKEFVIAWHRQIHQELLEALKSRDMAVIRRAMLRHCVEVVRFQMDDEKALGFDLEAILI